MRHDEDREARDIEEEIASLAGVGASASACASAAFVSLSSRDRRRSWSAARACSSRAPELKGSIGEGPNHSNFSDQSSVEILAKFKNFQCSPENFLKNQDISTFSKISAKFRQNLSNFEQNSMK